MESFLGRKRGKLASPNSGSAKARLFSKNKFAVHGSVEGVEGLQLTQLREDDGDPPPFPAWLKAGRQQHTSPQFIPQGSGRCKKAVTSIGAVRVAEQANSNQPIQNLFLNNFMDNFER
ncbi:MAG: hypothetical protein ONB46_02900 [candidate division KSB1 bacterium]|nr:hypothetical protein [candidate division KSB1 bacterium]